MSLRAFLIIICCITCSSISFIAQAKTVRSMPFLFGESDVLYPVEPRTFVHYQGVDYVLGSHLTKQWVFLGLGMTDKGYVLLNPYGNTSYLPLTGEQIAYLQQQKQLPQPLPAYKILLFDYMTAYSLWLFLLSVSIALYYGVRALRRVS